METAALTFERTWVLQALWLLPLLVALYWWAERRRAVMVGRIVAPKLRAALAGTASPLRRWFRASCVVLSIALLIATLAGPRLGYNTLQVPHRGRDVIIAMDVSRSMLAPDVAPSRLQRAKLLAEDLIGELGADRVGLVAFAGSAFLQAPLTLDHGAVLSALDELDTNVIPKGGTNISEAIRAAEEAFGKAEGFSRAVVIISDGEELDTDGLAAAKAAAADGIKIFTVGVGSTEGSEIPLGPGEFVRDPGTKKMVHSQLDEPRLREIAEAGGGFYARLAENTANLLAVDGIGKMAETDITANSSRRPIERYQWPLGAAIGLLLLQALVGERRRRIGAVVAAIWLAAAPAAWAAPAGLEAYERGNYEAAQKAFEARLRLEPDSPELKLNSGTAAYRLKDYAKASEYFSRAMLADDPALRSAAEFNLANTLFRQGEGQQDNEKKITDWKDAITKYDAAMKTRPDYTDAKENKVRVERLLKELEKQQKQEQKQDKKDQKQDQKDQGKDQQQKDQKQSGEGQDQKQEQSQGKDQKDQQQSGGGQGEKKDQQQNKEQQQKDQQQSGDGQNQQKQDQGEKSQDQKQSEGGGEKKQDEKPKQDGDQPKENDQQQKDQGDKKEDQGQPKDPQQGDPSQSSGESRPQQEPQGDKRGPVAQQPQEKKQGELHGAGEKSSDKKDGQEQQGMVAEEVEQDGKMSESQARALLRSLQTEEKRVDLLERETFQEVSRDW
jgi:Ca-activated chloride channel family protein